MILVIATIQRGVVGMVVLKLFIFQKPFGFMAFFWVTSLAGIVINNGIVLINPIEIEQKELKRTPQHDTIDTS